MIAPTDLIARARAAVTEADSALTAHQATCPSIEKKGRDGTCRSIPLYQDPNSPYKVREQQLERTARFARAELGRLLRAEEDRAARRLLREQVIAALAQGWTEAEYVAACGADAKGILADLVEEGIAKKVRGRYAPDSDEIRVAELVTRVFADLPPGEVATAKRLTNYTGIDRSRINDLLGRYLEMSGEVAYTIKVNVTTKREAFKPEVWAVLSRRWGWRDVNDPASLDDGMSPIALSQAAP